MKRGMQKEDLYQLKMASEAVISPDGSQVAYVITDLLEKTQVYHSVIYVNDRLIELGDSSKSPLFAPSGDAIAFLSNQTGTMQLYMVSLPQGEPRRLTSMRYGVNSFVWAPDGKKLYFIAEWDSKASKKEMLRELTQEEKDFAEADSKNHPLIIRDIVHKWDGQGYLTGRKTQVWSLDLESGAVQQLTAIDANCREMSISPDGSKLTYVSDPLVDNDYRPQDVHLWVLDTKTGESRLLIDGAIFVSFPAFLNAHTIIFSGHEAEYGWGTICRAYCYDLDTGSYSCISRDTDLSVTNTALGDFQQSSWGFRVDPQKEVAYFTASYFGSTQLFCIDGQGNVSPVLSGEFLIQCVDFSKDFSQAVAVISDPTTPGKVEKVDVASGKRTVLVDPNAKFFEQVEISVPERIRVESFDKLLIDGWIMKPIGFSPDKKYPAIIEIHGGPQCMYACNFMHEFQVLAAHGYVVGYFNPRGSSGYGQRFKSLIRREYGGVGTGDFMDIMTGADYVAALPYVDETRMGVTGGSYGGFMTNWAVSHTDRFKAAVTQRSISNWASFLGSSDYGFCDAELAHQCPSFGQRFELDRLSPISYVHNIHTPLLILHSACDYRCPLEQAEQLFTALKLLRRTVEMRIFPGQSHGLSRCGRPALRVERLDAMLGWFDKYLLAE